MKIAICDDDELCRAQVLAFAEEYRAARPDRSISFTAFSHAEDLMEAAAKNGGFDAYILDIVMPDINGIELGVRLRGAGYDGKIIYLSSSEEYALDSFKAKPFNYIIKPLKNDTFSATLDEALESVSARKDKALIVKTPDGSIKLAFDSIMYAQLVRRSVVYHLSSGKTVESVQIRTTFSEAVQELLGDSRFTLCRTSMIANLHHITMIENEALVFGNTHKVYLGKKACRDVRSVWYDFCFDGEGSR